MTLRNRAKVGRKEKLRAAIDVGRLDASRMSVTYKDRRPGRQTLRGHVREKSTRHRENAARPISEIDSMCLARSRKQ
ncbi:hypothetical protein EVAR_34448_1 [Eumeta japonica]|uniref:Uncharacterized protein n=1 Tax=Eumeta variegata TaxID=151549 RepID=A0A4C1WM50_EUMVA|nr:hypothetical protein EVAR_34448_1 [Eumeta japonica]